MKNAFESTFSQIRESKPASGDTMKSPQADVLVKDKMSTKQHVNKSTIKMIEAESIPAGLVRKTFYLKPELLEMFKYAKFKTKMGESQIANIALETHFNQQFGKNWRTLLK